VGATVAHIVQGLHWRARCSSGVGFQTALEFGPMLSGSFWASFWRARWCMYRVVHVMRVSARGVYTKFYGVVAVLMCCAMPCEALRTFVNPHACICAAFIGN
jgi:hypothetical protein